MLRIQHTTRIWATLLLVAALLTVTGCKKLSGSKDSVDQAAQSGEAYVDADDTYQIKNAPMKGNADALVTIVAFSEFQCPFCARVLPTLDEVMEKHGSDVRVFFKDLPLPFHKEAGPAARAAHAAGKQGKFWEYHDLLFENQKELNSAPYEKLAEQLGLDVEQFNADRDSDEIKQLVDASEKLAGELGVRGTPNFFVNGANIRGAQPVAAFDAIIEQEKKAMKELIDAGKSKEEALAERIEKNKSAAEPEAQRPDARPEPDPKDVLYVPVDGSPVRGNADALVTLVLFSDFECPFCKRIEPTIDQLVDEFGDDLRVVWKHNPLSFHPRAEPASRASWAAGQQGKFWDYHALVFENQKALSDDDLDKYAEELGLDMKKFKEDMNSDAAKEQIKKDQALAARTKAQGTPHSFVNGRRVRGAQPFDSFKKVVEEELAKAKESLSAQDQKKGAYEKLQANANKGEAKMIVPKGAPARQAEPAKPVEIPIGANVPSRGPADAKVTLVEYTDFECPFCGRFSKTLDEVLEDEEIASQVRVVVKQFPLGFHRNAHLASQAALAAHAQGKFWEYHDLLWDNQKALDRASLERYAEELGLNVKKFKKALDDETFKAQVDEEFKEGQGFGVSGTPTWFVNGVKESGALPAEAIKQKLLDAAKAAD